MIKKYSLSNILIFNLVNLIYCKLPYRPVVIIHGVLTGSESMELISSRIQEVNRKNVNKEIRKIIEQFPLKIHPGTQVYNTPRYAGWNSLEPMWHQVEQIGEDVMAIAAAYPEGINLLGYSQGGLVARAILQRYPEHNVRTFISLSSPQAGQFGS